MIKLRRNVETEDPRLDLIPQVDERNQNYPVAALLNSTEPKVNRQWGLETVLDQVQDGACVGCALTHELLAEPADWGPAFANFFGDEVSIMEKMARAVYFDAQRIDPWPGGEYPRARPTMSGTSLLAGVKVLHRQGWWSGYRWAFTVEEALATICEVGPVIYGGPWTVGMLDPTPVEGKIQATGRKVGGHAVLLSGVDLLGETVTVRNSWGRSWGQDGSAVLPIGDLKRLMAQGGEIVVPEDRFSPST